MPAPLPHASRRPAHPVAVLFRALLSVLLPTGLSGLAVAQSTWSRESSSTDESLLAAAHGGGLYVAVGTAGTIVNSVDGATWNAATSGTTANLRAVVHDGTQFVTAGGGGTILTSPDGATWTPRSTGVSSLLSGLAFGNGSYVAVGASGTVLSSPDAQSWTKAPTITGSFLQGVHHADGLFVAVGESGTILSSPDGLTWNLVVSPTISPLLGSGYFAGKHLAVGQEGLIASSPDGVNWALGNSGTLTRLRAIVDDGTSAIICGDDGILLRSNNAIDWVEIPSGLPASQIGTLRGGTFGDDRFVVVGEPVTQDGMVLVGPRDPGIRWEATAVEVNEAAGLASLLVRRLGSNSTPASLSFATASGSATEGEDFQASSGLASFAAGESVTTVNVPVTNNPAAEPEESFTVTLSAPNPPELLLYNPTTITVAIIDAQDSDFDGLPDAWELQYFGDVESHGPDDDPDGDGNSNARELTDGTDPSDVDSALYLLTVTHNSGGTVTVSPVLAAYPAGTTVTLTPVPSGEFYFDSWQGDLPSTTAPLPVEMRSDLTLEARFAVSLASALDDPCIAWLPGGTGPAWEGQGETSFDGLDAARVASLGVGQQSSLETTIEGPAQLSFLWKSAIGSFDSYRFFNGTIPLATLTGTRDWDARAFTMGPGPQTLRWVYSKNSSFGGGSNEAWLDQVVVSYGLDVWTSTYFNASELGDPAISGPEGDPEHDGFANLVEYLLNLHPKLTDSASPNLPIVSFEQSGGQTVSAITWTQHGKRAANVTVSIEFSPSLVPGSWQELAVAPELLSANGALETLRVTNPAPLSATPRGFYRMKVTLNP